MTETKRQIAARNRREREQQEYERFQAEIAAWERGEGPDLHPSSRPNEFDENLRSLVSNYANLSIDRRFPLGSLDDQEAFRESIEARAAWWREHGSNVEHQLLRRIMWAIATFTYEDDKSS